MFKKIPKNKPILVNDTLYDTLYDPYENHQIITR